MDNLKKLIKDRLKETTRCGFKKAWIPKGWACVQIETFSTELAKKIKEESKR